jgi:hypothetical protein
VDTDLVRAARFQADLEQRVLGQRLSHLEVSHGSTRLVGVERAARRHAAVASHRRVDSSRARARMPTHEREVAPLDLPPANRLLERRVRLLGAGDHEQPGGVAVEAVHDAGSDRVRSTRRAERQELSRQSPPGRARPRMHHEPGGLVEDHEVLILEEEGNGDRLGSEHGRLALGELDLDDGARLQPMALRPRDPVDLDGTVAQQSLRERACPDLPACGERPVEA